MASRPLVNRKAFVLALLIGASVCECAAIASSQPQLTIGGVIFMDVQDPLRSGLAGVTVTIEGSGGTFTATTDGVLGLWKTDVPPGTYTVTPRKRDYAMQHLVRGWCDGQASITIEVTPGNLAANQSIQFLAIDWPEPSPEPQPAAGDSDPGRSGGGCAACSRRDGDAAGFFAPYVGCLCTLAVRSLADRRRRVTRDGMSRSARR